MENVMIGTQEMQVEHRLPFRELLRQNDIAEVIQSNYSDGNATFNYLINASWFDGHCRHNYTVAVFRIKLKPHL